MSFIADKQTLDDLNLLGRYRPHSIIGLFGQVKTHGGGRLLESMFHEPLTDPARINARSGIFQYFQRKKLDFPFTAETVGVMENYLGMGTGSYLVIAAVDVLQKKMMSSLVRDTRYDLLHQGLLATISVLQGLGKLIDQLDKDGDSPYHDRVLDLRNFFSARRMEEILREDAQTLSVLKIASYDHLLKKRYAGEMEMVMGCLAELDLYIAVSDVARARNFSYAVARPKDENIFRARSLRHPGLEKAVGNSLSLDKDINMLFLTGANMAGKSTFMKSFGIGVYLAHMGFPVAAEQMVFSVRDGIYSSINVPDNLALGYSHFYAEVLRVKKVAEEVSADKDLIVIFDELFKGTNVKDAYDATLSVTEAFAQFRNCFFVISTHIIEVGETLGERCDNLQFAYLPTVMDGKVPRYPYIMQEGITSDRHGMMIIENEGILGIMKN